MKILRKTAGTVVLLILIFMIIALFQFQREEETAQIQKLEYHFNENWTIIHTGTAKTSSADLNHPAKIRQLIENSLTEGNFENADLPYEGTSKPDEIIIFKNTLPEDYAGMTLNFSSARAPACVYLDGELIYQYAADHSQTDKKPESTEYFADLPNTFKNGELWIALASPSADNAAALDTVIIETRDMMFIGLVGSNIADIGCCLLIMMMALIMFVLALIRQYTHQPARGEVYLGLAGLAAGIYCFIGTDTLYFIYNMQEPYVVQQYMALLVPLFLALYFERNLRLVYPRRFSALVLAASILALVQILLQILDIRQLSEMTSLSAAAIAVVCAAAVLSLIQFDRKNKQYQTLLSVLSMLVLLSGGAANIILNTAFGTVGDNTAGQYSMAVFSIMMTVMHILQLSKEYRSKAEENAHAALAANEAKGKFLAHMSHEIRTPINAVLGMDEMILRESKEQHIKEYAMDIYMAGQTLLSLINDILDFSKIESGKMEIVPVEYDFSSMIHDLTNMASQRAKDKNLRLEVHVDPGIPSRLYGDDVRLRQILTNLLTNAVKYTQEGTVWLRIQCSKKEETAVLTFEVEDTGIGIKEEDLPRLCAEFERIEEDRNRSIEGTGLGMSITLQLLELFGSSLKVESTYGKGSRFYFTLEQRIMDQTPIGDFESRVQQLAETYSYNARFCAPDAKILVVDDNAVNRKVLQNLLKETQIQITEADGGVKCLELVQDNHYDLIFLDHMMPEMDGVETLHRIKELSDSPCRDTPVVVLTANAVSGAKEKYLAEGFDDFLSKPIVPEKLEQMLQAMLPDELLQTAAEPAPALLQQTETLPQIDGLDWNYAWLHLPDKELLEFTVKEFYAQIDSAADQLAQAYAHITHAEHFEQVSAQSAKPADLEAYRIQVHAMKSLAATVGILPLSGAAKILEYAARDGNINIITSMTDIFLNEWRSYRQKLQGVFGLGTTPKKTVTDYSLLQALIEMLRLSMQEMDIDQADQLSGQLQEYDYPEEILPNIQKLAEAVTNLDPDETDRLAGILIEQMQN